MFEKIKKLRIKFINFKNKKVPKVQKPKENETVNAQKLKEVRTFSDSSSFTWYRIY